MTSHEVLTHMLPAWILGLVILFFTYRSKYQYLLRVEPKAVKFLTCFVFVLGIVRYFCYQKFHQMTIIPVDLKAAQAIPWWVALGVYSEDAIYVLPFVIFKDVVHGKKYMRLFYYALMFLMCLSFGAGHLYQSVATGIFMMFYIPIMMDLVRQFGVGTTMICHTIFDLVMIATTALAMKGS
jgi:hypothetical protein